MQTCNKIYKVTIVYLFFIFLYHSAVFSSEDLNKSVVFLKDIPRPVSALNNNNAKLWAILAIKTHPDEWEQVNNYLSKKCKFIGFSFKKLVGTNGKADYVCYGLYAFPYRMNLIRKFNEELSKFTRSNLLVVREGTISYAWQRLYSNYSKHEVSNYKSSYNLNLDTTIYASMKFRMTDNYKNFIYPVKALKNPIEFTATRYTEECRTFWKDSLNPSMIAADILTVKITAENPGETSQEIFLGSVIMKQTYPIKIPDKFQDPWNLSQSNQ